MKLFECIVNDGEDVYKELATANSRKALISEYGDKGEFIRIKDITSEYFNDKSVEMLNEDLIRMGWGTGERKIICALLEVHIRKEIK